MCNNCETNITTYAALGKVDPTRTSVLRQTFVRDINRRFNTIKKDIVKTIVQNDAFGLMQTNIAAGPNSFAFNNTGDKVEAFMEWFRKQVDNELLEVKYMNQIGQARNQAWTNMYVQPAYQKGLNRSRAEMIKAGIPNVPSIEATGGLRAAMGGPMHLDRLGMMYTRTFNELKSITAAMDSQISRVLTDAMANGDSPKVVARKLVATIDGKGNAVSKLAIKDSIGRYIPAQRRAQTMARTEIIRTHHQAMMQEYENWGVEGIKVQAEWSTAMDDRVCELCAPLQGTIYTLAEMQNMIPYHPNCRCMALPTEAPVTKKSNKTKTASKKTASAKKKKLNVPSPQKWETIEELPVTRNTKFDTEVINAINKEYGETYTLKSLSPREINNGFCDDWAQYYVGKNGGDMMSILDIVSDPGSGVHGHTFVKKDGLFIDAEHFTGVPNISDLNYFRRAMKFNKTIYDESFLKEEMFKRM